MAVKYITSLNVCREACACEGCVERLIRRYGIERVVRDAVEESFPMFSMPTFVYYDWRNR